MKFNKSFPPQYAAAQSAEPVPALVFLKTKVVIPKEAGINTNLKSIAVDVDETFEKYDRFLLRFSEIGLGVPGSSDNLRPRKNGGAANVLISSHSWNYYTATNTWYAITSGIPLSWWALTRRADDWIRCCDIELCRDGFSHSTQLHQVTSGASTAGQSYGTASYPIVNGQGFYYSEKDSPGIELQATNNGGFTLPGYGDINSTSRFLTDVTCDIYGWVKP
jgi:hypothetical protein